MLLAVPIVFTAYASVRFYENYRRNKNNKISQGDDEKIIDKAEKSEKFSESMIIKADENDRNKHYVKMSGLTIGIATIRNFYPPLTLISLAAFTYTAIPYIRQTETSLIKNKKIDGYVLYFLADTIMLGLGAYASASIGIGMLHLAKYILSNAKEKSKEKVVSVFSHQSDNVWILKKGVEVQVPIDSVRKGDILIVHTGDIIPVDGIVTDGIAAIDQRVLTGESQPADKSADDKVFASTIVMSGRISICIEKSGQETTVAKIGDIINNSIDFKSSHELKGEKWADSYNAPILLLALMSGPFLGHVGIVGILYSHIANTIRVVAPLGTLKHLDLAINNGMLVKDGRVLEDIKDVDTIIFDKTGTLTQDLPKVGRIILSDSHYSKDEILYYAAAAEYKSEHPIAKAILKKAEDKNIILPKIDDLSYKIGYGITVNIDGKTIHIGSIRFMQMENIKINKNMNDKMEKAFAMGHSIIMLAIDSKLQGIFVMHATVRPEVQNVINILRQNGIKYMAIVSGDHERPTKALAKSLGMDSYYYEILPENKAEIVENLQKEGKKVAVVGDGVNDAIAMQKADVSISLSGATTIATDVAQVILMDGSLARLPDLFELSMKLDKNLSRSLILNLIPNAIALNGVLFFHFGMLTTILVSQSALVFGGINALFPFEKNTTDDKKDDYVKSSNQ